MAVISGTPNNDSLIGNDLDTTITNAGDIILAQRGDDFLFGLRGDDQLFGNEGHDILYGGLGNDVIEGGTGNDNLFGEDGDDRLVGSSNTNPNSVANNVSELIGLTYGVEVDTLTGGAGADIFALVSESALDLVEEVNFYQDGGYAVITDYSNVEGDIFEITGSPDEFVWSTQVVAGIGTEAVDTLLFHQDSVIAIFQDIEASQVTVVYTSLEQIDI